MSDVPASDTQHLLALETGTERDASENEPKPLPGFGRLKWMLLLTTAVLSVMGVAWLGLRTAMNHADWPAGLVQNDAVQLVAVDEPYAAWHIAHGSETKSSKGIGYALHHDKPLENYATKGDAYKKKFGGAWLITYKEGGKEYLCKASHYDSYWKPVVDSLCWQHDIDATGAAKAVCDRSYATWHIAHGSETKSSSGIGYALRHNKALAHFGTRVEAIKKKFGGAYMITKETGGKEYLCKASHYDSYWKPVVDSLCDKHHIDHSASAKKMCGES